MRALILIAFLIACSTPATNDLVFGTTDGAIQGIDPVAYFTEAKPVKGDARYTYKYLDQRWQFASQEHLEMFKENPEKYMPQFGGYCAFGMSRGYKAQTSPEAWTIVDGKLYLNYNLEVRERWNEKQADFIKQAEANWPTVKNEKFSK